MPLWGAATEEKKGRIKGKFMRSLIIEHDLECRRILCETLKQYGECCFAENRDDGIDVFREAWMTGKPFQLVCLDIMMPNMEGTELLHLIHASVSGMMLEGYTQPQILLTTSMTDTANVAEYYQKICDYHLTKPITIEELQETLTVMGFAADREVIT